MFCPKRSHGTLLKRLVQYLNQTKDFGLVLKPNSNVCKIDAYPDADFAGMFGHENTTDLACVKIRTGFVINFADSTVIWVSKLQTETTLSNTEWEIITLNHCLRELFTIIDIKVSLIQKLSCLAVTL